MEDKAVAFLGDRSVGFDKGFAVPIDDRVVNAA